MYDIGYLNTLAAILALLVTILVVVVEILVLYYFIGMWRFFKKLGIPGWKSLIPFYREWVLYENVGLEWYWFVGYLVSILLVVSNTDTGIALSILVFSVVHLGCIYNVAKKFRQPKEWLVLSFIFSCISLPVLGLDEAAEAAKDAILTPNAMFDDKVKKTAVRKAKPKAKTKEDK